VLGAPDGDNGVESCAAFDVDTVVDEDSTESILWNSDADEVVGAMDVDMEPLSEIKVEAVDVLDVPDGEYGFESCAAFAVNEVVVEDATESILWRVVADEVVGAEDIAMKPLSEMKVEAVDVLDVPDGENGSESWTTFIGEEFAVENVAESILWIVVVDEVVDTWFELTVPVVSATASIK